MIIDRDSIFASFRRNNELNRIIKAARDNFRVAQRNAVNSNDQLQHFMDAMSLNAERRYEARKELADARKENNKALRALHKAEKKSLKELKDQVKDEQKEADGLDL